MAKIKIKPAAEAVRWFIVPASGIVYYWTGNCTRRDCIRAFTKEFGKTPAYWPRLRKDGLRCIKCRIVPTQP